MYSIKSRVRYTEVDEHRKLTIFGIINYFQDCSIFHSEDLGVGMEYLEQRNLAWWLLNWQIDIIKRPMLGEWIEVGTFAYDFKRFFGMRNFFMKNEKGEIICRADSKWIHMDQKKQIPVKASLDIANLYLNHNHTPFLMYDFLQFEVEGKEPVWEKKMTVSHFLLDTNQHVNNARYVDIALEGIREYLYEKGMPFCAEITSVKADYKRAAILGDEMSIRIYEFEQGFAVGIDNEEQSFAKITLYKKV